MESREYSARHRLAVDTAITEHAARPGGLLPLLHAIQDGLGFIPPEAIEPIARALKASDDGEVEMQLLVQGRQIATGAADGFDDAHAIDHAQRSRGP